MPSKLKNILLFKMKIKIKSNKMKRQTTHRENFAKQVFVKDCIHSIYRTLKTQ